MDRRFGPESGPNDESGRDNRGRGPGSDRGRRPEGDHNNTPPDGFPPHDAREHPYDRPPHDHHHHEAKADHSGGSTSESTDSSGRSDGSEDKSADDKYKDPYERTRSRYEYRTDDGRLSAIDLTAGSDGPTSTGNKDFDEICARVKAGDLQIGDENDLVLIGATDATGSEAGSFVGSDGKPLSNRFLAQMLQHYFRKNGERAGGRLIVLAPGAERQTVLTITDLSRKKPKEQHEVLEKSAANRLSSLLDDSTEVCTVAAEHLRMTSAGIKSRVFDFNGLPAYKTDGNPLYRTGLAMQHYQNGVNISNQARKNIKHSIPAGAKDKLRFNEVLSEVNKHGKSRDQLVSPYRTDVIDEDMKLIGLCYGDKDPERLRAQADPHALNISFPTVLGAMEDPETGELRESEAALICIKNKIERTSTNNKDKTGATSIAAEIALAIIAKNEHAKGTAYLKLIDYPDVLYKGSEKNPYGILAQQLTDAVSAEIEKQSGISCTVTTRCAGEHRRADTIHKEGDKNPTISLTPVSEVYFTSKKSLTRELFGESRSSKKERKELQRLLNLDNQDHAALETNPRHALAAAKDAAIEYRDDTGEFAGIYLGKVWPKSSEISPELKMRIAAYEQDKRAAMQPQHREIAEAFKQHAKDNLPSGARFVTLGMESPVPTPSDQKKISKDTHYFPLGNGNNQGFKIGAASIAGVLAEKFAHEGYHHEEPDIFVALAKLPGQKNVLTDSPVRSWATPTDDSIEPEQFLAQLATKISTEFEEQTGRRATVHVLVPSFKDDKLTPAAEWQSFTSKKQRRNRDGDQMTASGSEGPNEGGDDGSPSGGVGGGGPIPPTSGGGGARSPETTGNSAIVPIKTRPGDWRKPGEPGFGPRTADRHSSPGDRENIDEGVFNPPGASDGPAPGGDGGGEFHPPGADGGFGGGPGPGDEGPGTGGRGGWNEGDDKGGDFDDKIGGSGGGSDEKRRGGGGRRYDHRGRPDGPDNRGGGDDWDGPNDYDWGSDDSDDRNGRGGGGGDDREGRGEPRNRKRDWDDWGGDRDERKGRGRPKNRHGRDYDDWNGRGFRQRNRDRRRERQEDTNPPNPKTQDARRPERSVPKQIKDVIRAGVGGGVGALFGAASIAKGMGDELLSGKRGPGTFFMSEGGDAVRHGAESIGGSAGPAPDMLGYAGDAPAGSHIPNWMSPTDYEGWAGVGEQQNAPVFPVTSQENGDQPGSRSFHFPSRPDLGGMTADEAAAAAGEHFPGRTPMHLSEGPFGGAADSASSKLSPAAELSQAMAANGNANSDVLDFRHDQFSGLQDQNSLLQNASVGRNGEGMDGEGSSSWLETIVEAFVSAFAGIFEGMTDGLMIFSSQDPEGRQANDQDREGWRRRRRELDAQGSDEDPHAAMA